MIAPPVPIMVSVFYNVLCKLSCIRLCANLHHRRGRASSHTHKKKCSAQQVQGTVDDNTQHWTAHNCQESVAFLMVHAWPQVSVPRMICSGAHVTPTKERRVQQPLMAIAAHCVRFHRLFSPAVLPINTTAMVLFPNHPNTESCVCSVRSSRLPS